MHGQAFKQVCRLIKVSGIKEAKGSSKHEARKEFRVKFKEENGRNPNSKEIAKNIGIFSQKTLVNYRSVWSQFANHLRERGVKDLEKASARQVQKFLVSKIEQGVSHKYYKDCCSAMRKFETALNIYAEKEQTGKAYDFEKRIENTKELADATLEKEISARAYQDAQVVVDAIKNDAHQVAASVMFEGGGRIHEVSLVDNDRLGGIKGDVGVIHLQNADAKGGKERDLNVTKETYKRIESYVREHGKFHIPKSERQELRNSIKEAAERVGQKYTGAHGLRHNFAQNRVAELQAEGKSYGDALAQTSRELGHERPSITLHYLRS